MAARRQQTHAKRARELAVKEKRERKAQKKADRAAGLLPEPEYENWNENGHGIPDAENQAEAAEGSDPETGPNEKTGPDEGEIADVDAPVVDP